MPSQPFAQFTAHLDEMTEVLEQFEQAVPVEEDSLHELIGELHAWQQVSRGSDEASLALRQELLDGLLERLRDAGGADLSEEAAELMQVMEQVDLALRQVLSPEVAVGERDETQPAQEIKEMQAPEIASATDVPSFAPQATSPDPQAALAVDAQALQTVIDQLAAEKDRPVPVRAERYQKGAKAVQRAMRSHLAVAKRLAKSTDAETLDHYAQSADKLQRELEAMKALLGSSPSRLQSEWLARLGAVAATPLMATPAVYEITDQDLLVAHTALTNLRAITQDLAQACANPTLQATAQAEQYDALQQVGRSAFDYAGKLAAVVDPYSEELDAGLYLDNERLLLLALAELSSLRKPLLVVDALSDERVVAALKESEAGEQRAVQSLAPLHPVFAQAYVPDTELAPVETVSGELLLDADLPQQVAEENLNAEPQPAALEEHDSAPDPAAREDIPLELIEQADDLTPAEQSTSSQDFGPTELQGMLQELRVQQQKHAQLIERSSQNLIQQSEQIAQQAAEKAATQAAEQAAQAVRANLQDTPVDIPTPVADQLTQIASSLQELGAQIATSAQQQELSRAELVAERETLQQQLREQSSDELTARLGDVESALSAKIETTPSGLAEQLTALRKQLDTMARRQEQMLARQESAELAAEAQTQPLPVVADAEDHAGHPLETDVAVDAVETAVEIEREDAQQVSAPADLRPVSVKLHDAAMAFELMEETAFIGGSETRANVAQVLDRWSNYADALEHPDQLDALAFNQVRHEYGQMLELLAMDAAFMTAVVRNDEYGEWILSSVASELAMLRENPSLYPEQLEQLAAAARVPGSKLSRLQMHGLDRLHAHPEFGEAAQSASGLMDEAHANRSELLQLIATPAAEPRRIRLAYSSYLRHVGQAQRVIEEGGEPLTRALGSEGLNMFDQAITWFDADKKACRQILEARIAGQSVQAPAPQIQGELGGEGVTHAIEQAVAVPGPTEGLLAGHGVSAAATGAGVSGIERRHELRQRSQRSEAEKARIEARRQEIEQQLAQVRPRGGKVKRVDTAKLAEHRPTSHRGTWKMFKEAIKTDLTNLRSRRRNDVAPEAWLEGSDGYVGHEQWAAERNAEQQRLQAELSALNAQPTAPEADPLAPPTPGPVEPELHVPSEEPAVAETQPIWTEPFNMDAPREPEPWEIIEPVEPTFYDHEQDAGLQWGGPVAQPPVQPPTGAIYDHQADVGPWGPEQDIQTQWVPQEPPRPTWTPDPATAWKPAPAAPASRFDGDMPPVRRSDEFGYEHGAPTPQQPRRGRFERPNEF